MNSLEDYFTNPDLPFKSDEIDHVLMAAYSIIRSTIRYVKEKNADTFTVYKDRIVRTDKEGMIINQINQPVDIRPYFRKILQRDKVIADHLIIIKENEEFMQFLLNL